VAIYQKEAIGKRKVEVDKKSVSAAKPVESVEMKDVPYRPEENKHRGRVLSARNEHEEISLNKSYQLEASTGLNRPSASAFEKRRKSSKHNRNTEVRGKSNF
jgi:hypothetical protein